MHLNVEVAGRAAGDGLSHAAEADHLPTVYAGRDSDFYLILLFVHAFAAARATLFFRNFARSAAVSTRLHHCYCAKKRVGGLMDLARTVAVRAGEHFGVFCGAGALAGVAERCLCQQYGALCPKDGVAKRDFQIDRNVAAAACPCRAAREEIGKYVPHVKPGGRAIEGTGKVVHIKPAEPACSRACRRTSAEDLAVAVVLGAPLVVGEDAVRLAHLLKLVRIPLLFVGMELVREFMEGLFYFFFGGTFLHP